MPRNTSIGSEGTTCGTGGNPSANADLRFLKTRATTLGAVEVHVATAASGYGASGGNWSSAFSVLDAGNGPFQMINADGDTNPDLVFIKEATTGSGRIEVHVRTAASAFQDSGGSWGSRYSEAESQNGSFQMAHMDADGRPDLVFVKQIDTSGGRIEVHVASGASGYVDSGGDWASRFSSANAPNCTFQLIDMDGDARPDLGVHQASRLGLRPYRGARRHGRVGIRIRRR